MNRSRIVKSEWPAGRLSLRGCFARRGAALCNIFHGMDKLYPNTGSAYNFIE